MALDKGKDKDEKKDKDEEKGKEEEKDKDNFEDADMLRKHYPTSSWLSTPWMLRRRRKRMVMVKLLFSFTMVTLFKIIMFTFLDQERTLWLSNVDVGSSQ